MHTVDFGEEEGIVLKFSPREGEASASPEVERRLEEIERIKRDFVARVAHELNTPLTALMGFAELLKEPEFLDEETIQEFGREIWGASRRLHLVFTDLLNLTKIEAGVFEYALEVTEPIDLVEAALRNSTDEYEGKGVVLRARFEDAIPLIWVDRARLGDILDRILVNALDHSQSGEEVFIRVRQDGDEVLIEVADGGRGLEPEEVDRVFEGFAQIEDIRSIPSAWA